MPFIRMAAFSLHLERKIESGFVVSGKFDGSHACIVAATSGGNILVHSPHRRKVLDPDDDAGSGRLSWIGEIAELRIGKRVRIRERKKEINVLNFVG